MLSVLCSLEQRDQVRIQFSPNVYFYNYLSRIDIMAQTNYTYIGSELLTGTAVSHIWN